MAISKAWREGIEEKLSASGMITVKSMFGGLGIYRDGLLFAVADNDELFFKTDALTSSDFESRSMPAFDPMNTGKPMSYHRLPDEILDSSSELGVWIDKALGAAARKPPAKKRSKK
jgi:DNA transformation protein